MKAFTNTTVSVAKSMSDIDAMLTRHGVRDCRYTNSRPERPGAAGEQGQGTIVYEFVLPERGQQERRGVRLVVTYRHEIGPRGGRGGVTAGQAARALFWHLKSKFDSIEFGIETFDVAFMPYLRTQLADGGTLAENPRLLSEFVARPLAIRSLLALPSPGEVRTNGTDEPPK